MSDPVEEPTVVPAVPEVVSRVLSVDHPAASTECAKWVSHRRTTYGNGSRSKLGRVVVPIEQELSRLRDARLALIETAAAVRVGQQHHVGSIAASLRALLVEKLRGGVPNPNYSPLLFRVASKFDLPLPIYATPQPPPPDAVTQALFDEALSTGHIPIAGVSQTLQSQVIQDIQQWLAVEILITRPPPPAQEIRRTVYSFVSDYAQTIGGAHFDAEVPVDLDAFKRSLKNQTSNATLFLLGISDLAIALSEYVLVQAAANGVHPAD